MNIEIENITNYFVKNKISFTSVDVSNEYKKNGLWKKNSEISKILRKDFDLISNDYQISEIEVKRAEDNKTVNAILYHHKSINPKDYDNLEGKPMKPDELLKTRLVKKLNFTHHTKKKLKLMEKKKDKKIEKKEIVKKQEPKITKKKKEIKKSVRDYSKFCFL